MASVTSKSPSKPVQALVYGRFSNALIKLHAELYSALADEITIS